MFGLLRLVHAVELRGPHAGVNVRGRDHVEGIVAFEGEDAVGEVGIDCFSMREVVVLAGGLGKVSKALAECLC